MARTTSLAVYAVKVWSLEDGEYETISSFSGDSDLLDFFQTFLSGLQKKTSRNKTVQQVLRVQSLKRDGRRACGIIETGEYGLESTLINVDTEAVVHRRKTSEANMLPFYFLVDLPGEADEGLILLQRTGMYGIRKMLSEVFSQEFEARFSNYRLHLHPLVESGEIKKYQRGKIESIRFINFQIPSDITDAFDSGHKETKGTVELVVRARRGQSLPIGDRLRQFFSGRRQLGKFIALDETNFKYQNVKVKSRVGGSTRTVDLAHLNHLRSYYDISERVELDTKSGHPKFESINRLADELVARIKDDIGLSDG